MLDGQRLKIQLGLIVIIRFVVVTYAISDLSILRITYFNFVVLLLLAVQVFFELVW